jgi:hypothetical protein
MADPTFETYGPKTDSELRRSPSGEASRPELLQRAWILKVGWIVMLTERGLANVAIRLSTKRYALTRGCAYRG